ncbi:DUF3667 domain-containing protein [Longimicrobium sp.]|uniref:DUF3667 domain-containing protein n=1 Tax=Longimicrobium sp. TaxID=2029185 RepID=UPI002EDB0FFE
MPDPTAAPPPFPSAGPEPPDPRGEPPVPISPIRRQRWWARETRRTPDRPCLNCGDTTVGFFCRNCGQRKADVRVSLRRMLMEVMDDQLSLNSTLPRTIGALLFRPGHLTAEYVQGRIMRYVPPFRLYLVTSVLFFILLPVVADVNRIADEVTLDSEQNDARERAQDDSARIVDQRARADSVKARIAAVRRGEVPRGEVAPPPLPPVPPKPDSGKVSLNLAFSDTNRVPAWLKPLNRRMQRTEDRLEGMPPREALRTVLAAMEENAPKGVFLMMPLFAFILKLLYVRRKRFYVEHFVFALHVHAMAFLLFTVGMVSGLGWLRNVLSLWMTLYVFLAMRKVYGQGIIRTFLKFCALGGAYMIFGMTVGAIATLMFAALSM